MKNFTALVKAAAIAESIQGGMSFPSCSLACANVCVSVLFVIATRQSKRVHRGICECWSATSLEHPEHEQTQGHAAQQADRQAKRAPAGCEIWSRRSAALSVSWLKWEWLGLRLKRQHGPDRARACAGDYDTGVAQLFDKKVDPTGEGSDGSNRLQRRAQVQSVYVHVCVRGQACLLLDFWRLNPKP